MAVAEGAVLVAIVLLLLYARLEWASTQGGAPATGTPVRGATANPVSDPAHHGAHESDPGAGAWEPGP